MRKGCDRGETEGKNKAKKTVEKKKKIKKIFVATNVVASPPPECPPTGMLTLVPKEKENIPNQRMSKKLKNWLKTEEKEEKETPKEVKKKHIKKDKLGLNWASSAQTGIRIWCKIEPH